MSIEKMNLLNLVVEKEDAYDVLKDIALMENIHLDNSLEEISESNFLLKVDEDYLDEVAGLCYIDTFSEKRDYKLITERLYELMDYINIEKVINKADLEKNIDIELEVNEIHDELIDIRSRIKELKLEKETLSYVEILKGIYEENIDFKKLYNLEYFSVKFGILAKENMDKLVRNYENIYAAIMQIGKRGHNEIFVIVSLKELEIETDRILRSVYFEEIKMTEEYLDTPSKMIEKIEDRLRFVEQEIEGLSLRAHEYDVKHGRTLAICYSHLMLGVKIEKMKKQLAVTNNYVYITGWASKRDTEKLKIKLSKYGKNLIFGFRDVSEVTRTLLPPTKLKNHKFFKPFEALVHMYGTPNYNELDPTIFVAIAYMLLFGAMFGDLGQGLVLVIAGMLVLRKDKDNLFGGILKRIGISSMIFGFIYDSFFGYEHFISKIFGNIFSEKLANRIFFRPIENINQILLLAVISGLVFLLISYCYSIINKLRNKDIKEGIFGRNGINGVILYGAVLLLALKAFLNIDWIPSNLLKVIILISVILMVVREPLSNMIKKKKPLYHETVSEYYTESSFELLETFLGMLSNTVSFVRVGAFALNHVGLFMAFHTIAKLIDSAFGEVSMFIVGNLLVLALEGLIVLIQGLRLVYYEMFSKFYEGAGLKFEPVKLENVGGIE